MLKRCDNWYPRIVAIQSNYYMRPFRWGETDCAHFAADCVEAMTFDDLLKLFRGRYHSRLTAFSRLHFRGYRSVTEALAATMAASHCPEIPPALSRYGDVGVTADHVIAVRFPKGFIARVEQGHFAIARVERAWSVG